MADRSEDASREQVFCHECQGEWLRADHGIICPNCGSDFTEIIEQDHDPREVHMPDIIGESSQNLLDSFMPFPWTEHGSTPREGRNENRFEQRSGPDGSVHFTRVVINSDTPRGGGAEPGHTTSPIFDSFQQMLQNIMGRDATPHNHHRSRSPSQMGEHQRSNTSEQGYGPSNTSNPGGPLGGSPAFFSSPFVGGTITFSSGSRLLPRDAHNPQPPAQVVDDLPSLLSRIVNDLHNTNGPDLRRPQDGGDRMPMNPLLGLFASFLNPPGTPQGDVVYSQEALDRVISQLMEQYSGGNAPGPASENAISSLPRKKISLDMLDDEGKAECTICMDDVPVGGEVMDLPCGHWFHEQCGSAWLREHDTCPICRKGIMPKEGAGERSRMPGQEARHQEPWRSQGLSGDGSGRPSPSRHASSFSQQQSGAPEQSGSRTGAEGSSGSGGGGGISGRVRGWFGGGGSGGGSGS